jgi:hypothetical protein
MGRLCVLTVLASWLLPPIALAQRLEGVATAGVHHCCTGGRAVGVGGGVLVAVNPTWLSVGATADLFAAPPYFVGRVTLLAQGNLLSHRTIRPFVLAGGSFGQYAAGPMLGGGIDIRPTPARGLPRIRRSAHSEAATGLPGVDRRLLRGLPTWRSSFYPVSTIHQCGRDLAVGVGASAFVLPDFRGRVPFPIEAIG